MSILILLMKEGMPSFSTLNICSPSSPFLSINISLKINQYQKIIPHTWQVKQKTDHDFKSSESQEEMTCPVLNRKEMTKKKRQKGKRLKKKKGKKWVPNLIFWHQSHFFSNLHLITTLYHNSRLKPPRSTREWVETSLKSRRWWKPTFLYNF